MLNHILVATDASGPSNRAIKLAADLAARYDATLHLLHVIRDMDLPPDLKKMAEVEEIQGARQDVLEFVAKKILNDAKDRARSGGAKRIETAIGAGDPASAIIAEAKARQADLIVMGTRGLGQIKGALMGSVSRKVSNMSGINLLMVR